MMLKFIYIFLFFLLFAFYGIVPHEMDKTVMSILLVVVLFIIVLFIARKEGDKNVKGQFLRHSTLFLLGFLIVHFQYYFDYVLGYTTEANWIIWIDPTIVVKSMVLSMLGLLSFLLGYIIFSKPRVKIKRPSIIQKGVGVKVLVILCFLSLVAFFATVNPLYLLGYYGQADIGQNAAYAVLVFEALVYAIVVQNCRNMVLEGKIPTTIKGYVQGHGYFFTSIVGLYLLAVMLSGDRGPLMTMGLCLVSGYFFVTKKRLSIKTWMLLLFAGATFITLLGRIRSLDRDVSFSERLQQTVEGDVELYEEESVSPQTQELASSVKAFHLTVSYIPNQHDYLYGRFQFQEVGVMIPFFSFFSNAIFTDKHYKYEGSSKFVTWINQGEFPLYGDGTTCLADFYFDFGMFGIIGGMFIFGFVLRQCELAMYMPGLPSLFVHALMTVYLSFAIYIARSSVLMQVKLLSLVIIFLVINRYLFNKYKN